MKASQAELDAANAAVEEQDAAAKKIAMALAEKGRLGKKGAPPTLPDNISELTVAELQAELKKNGLNTEWDPAKGKSVLVDRLTVRLHTDTVHDLDLDFVPGASYTCINCEVITFSARFDPCGFPLCK